MPRFSIDMSGFSTSNSVVSQDSIRIFSSNKIGQNHEYLFTHKMQVSLKLARGRHS